MTDTKNAFRQRFYAAREHWKLMDKWISPRMAITTLNMESLERTGKLYMKKKSIKGKSPYLFHRKRRLSSHNVTHIIMGRYESEA